ncbi:hypothetical protein FOZ62_032485, partial [Perkinsus olseni]
MTDPGGDMVDADAIFVVKLLEAQLDRTAPYRSESPRPMIFVELVKGENAKFIPLDPTSAPTRSADSRGSNYQLGIEVYRSPRYMSGSVFLNSIFSNLGVNILYNSSLLTLIEELITAPSLAVKISPEWAGRPFHVLYTFLLHRHNLTAIALKRVTPKRRSQAGRTSVTQGQRRSRSRNSRRSQAWIDTDFDEGYFLDMEKTGESGLWEALGLRIKRLMGELVETRRQRKPEPAPDEFIVTAPYADAILSVGGPLSTEWMGIGIQPHRYRTESSALRESTNSIFERMERCEGERDEALALVRSWKDRRAEFERSEDTTEVAIVCGYGRSAAVSVNAFFKDLCAALPYDHLFCRLIDFELTKNKLKAVKEIINNNSSEMSLKVEHLAQMAKQNQGLLTVLEQLESSKREIEEGERTRKENM